MYTTFESNNPNVICDICGVKFKRSQCRKTWNGYLACLPNDCWFPKHPADDPLPIVVDNLAVKDARPDSPADFLEEGDRTRWGGAWFILQGGQLGDPTITINNPVWGSLTGAKWGELG